MKKGEYSPGELLEILRKVWPDAYRHIIWLIKSHLKMIQHK
jgi:hypothetical protein